MVEDYGDRIPSIRRAPPNLLLTGLRLVLVVLLAKPALSKVVTYGNSVAFFDAIGMPIPAVMVIVAGFIEVAAGVLLFFGIGGRVAAASLIPVMFVAMVYVGPDWKNLSVLVGSIAIVLFGTGSYSVWQPSERILGEVTLTG